MTMPGTALKCGDRITHVCLFPLRVLFASSSRPLRLLFVSSSSPLRLLFVSSSSPLLIFTGWPTPLDGGMHALVARLRDDAAAQHAQGQLVITGHLDGTVCFWFSTVSGGTESGDVSMEGDAGLRAAAPASPMIRLYEFELRIACDLAGVVMNKAEAESQASPVTAQIIAHTQHDPAVKVRGGHSPFTPLHSSSLPFISPFALPPPGQGETLTAALASRSPCAVTCAGAGPSRGEGQLRHPVTAARTPCSTLQQRAVEGAGGGAGAEQGAREALGRARARAGS